MAFEKELQEAQAHLSGKFSERRKYLEILINYLNNEELIKSINEEHSFNWKTLLRDSQDCLKTECDRIASLVAKKGPLKSPDKNVELSIELLRLVVKTALQHGEEEINRSSFISYIDACLRDRTMRCCKDAFLGMIKEAILQNIGCLGSLEPEDFVLIFEILRTELEKTNSGLESKNMTIFNCFSLLVKYGPFAAFPSNFLREQFPFFSKLCQSVTQNDPRILQEDVIDIVLNFCKHTAEDNRLSCIKLGVEVFPTLVNLYTSCRCDSLLKVKVINFFLLQVVLHSPNGILENDDQTLAFKPTTWKSCIKKIHNLLLKEIHQYLRQSVKNTQFFVPCEDNTVIIDNSFVFLFVETCRQLFNYTDQPIHSYDDSHPQKRMRIEMSLENIVSEIQESNSWVWIKLVGALLNKYPKLIDKMLFSKLLQVLHTIQLEVKDNNTISCVYEAQAILLDIEELLDVDQADTFHLWTLVGGSTLRAVGLNQHIKETQKLLTKLISRNIIKVESVIQTYTSGVLITTEHHLNTLQLILQSTNFSQLSLSRKEELFGSLLNVPNIKNYRCLLKRNFGEVLVALTLKHCPDFRQEHKSDSTICAYEKLAALYAKSSFSVDQILINTLAKEAGKKRNFTVDNAAVDILLKKLKVFVDSMFSEPIDRLLCTVGLLYNTASCMIDYQVIHETQLKKSLIFQLIGTILTNNSLLSFQRFQMHNDNVLNELRNITLILDEIFSLNNSVTKSVKELISFDFLKEILQIFQFFQDVPIKKAELKHTVKKLLVGALSKYCLVSNSTEWSQYQPHIAELLAKPDYDFKKETECDLSIAFLENVKLAPPGLLSEDVIEKILECVHKFAAENYRYYESAEIILGILADLVPHLQYVNRCHTVTAVNLLQIFYRRRSYYGPNVVIALLGAIEELCTADPNCFYSQWEGKEVIKYVPEFLSSNFQRVRYRAVTVLVKYLKISSATTRLKTIHLSEELFNLIYEWNSRVFEVADNLDEQRLQDEIACRASSALYTFLAIIVNCNNWIEESLFAIIKLEHDKGLCKVSHGDVISKVLKALKQHFGSEDFVRTHVDHILNKWIDLHYSIDDFQYRLLGCSDKAELYTKYLDICLPLLLQKDRNDLFAVAKRLNMTETEVLEQCCTKIFGRAISRDVSNLGGDFVENNLEVSYISQKLGCKFHEILVNNIDQIILTLIEGITDEEAIQQSLGETVFFTSKVISLSDFQLCLQFVETSLCGASGVISFLNDGKIDKIEKVILSLQCRIYDARIDQHLKYFHHYTVFVNLILENLNKECIFLIYFLRDTIHFLINLLGNTIAYHQLSKSILRYTLLFLRSVLPKNANEFKQFFIFATNSFKNIAIENNALSPLCIEILEFLIITNETSFLDVIEKLDTFPITAKFKNIQEKHNAIKHINRMVSLEDEIRLFLDYHDLTTRQDSLTHLRKLLANEKTQLSQLYEKLNELRGFSEDCEHSLLHRLTTMLIKISCHHSENISLEAIKCLGELGPANLRTIVLEPEKKVLNIKCTPFELLTGHVVSMLAQFIIDIDINVVRTASSALHEVFRYEESKRVVDASKDFGYGSININFITPFINRCENRTLKVILAEKKLGQILDDSEIWCPTRLVENDQWITSLVLALLNSFDDGCYLKSLIDLCTVKAKFCENILPLLIYLMLSPNKDVVTRILATQINKFFIQHWKLTVSTPTTENVIAVNKKSVKCMLDVINFIRQQPSVCSKFENMELDYLAIAKAAAFCSAHFSALLYAELWCQEKIAEIQKQRKNPKTGTPFENGFTYLDQILETVPEEIRVTFQHILQISYKSIGDSDALSGCGISLLLLPEYRVEYYKNTGQWSRVMDYYIMHSIQPHTKPNTDNLLLSFKMNHLYQMPLLCESESGEPDYECLWRLGQWKMNKMNNTKVHKICNDDYEQCKFNCLKAVCDNDEYTFSIAKRQMSMCIIDKLKHTSLESSNSLYPIFSQLQSLNEVEECLNFFEGHHIDEILAKWRVHDMIIRKNDFQFVEPIAAQRITLLRELSGRELKLRKAYCEMVLNFVDYAKDECHIKVAENALIRIQNIPDLDQTIENELQLRIVQLAWLNGDKLMAQQRLRKISLSPDITPRLKAKSLMLQGIYMAEMYSDRASILNSFESSLQIYEQIQVEERTDEDLRNLEDIYDKLATFADREYQQIMAHIKSDLFQKKLSNMQSSKEMAIALQKQKQKTYDEKKARAINEKQICIDENEIKTAFTDKDLVLQTALKHHINNLVASDVNNIKIFRLMALFIENKENKNAIEMLERMIAKMPSYKYIPMLPQLIPHITNNQHDFFGLQINRIIERCSTDHPYHTLPLLLALVNANKDGEYTNSKKVCANDRSTTAIAIIKKLKKTALGNIVDRMLKMSLALIELAYLPKSSAGNGQFEIPRKYTIHSIKGFDDILVPTCTVPPSKTNSYNTIEGIHKFNTKYKTVGGINAPKRIECVGTSGHTYLQLVKGQDDLRQDAVMQQVFTIMTDLLSSNKHTKSLCIRTYKVVPLSMRSGILEWVANTMPIGDYLAGSKESDTMGAHIKFRPKDKPPNACKKLLSACQGRSNEVKLSTYMSICKELQPVFHKFFETYFRQPSVWYERRRAYIHSVATTSMCGYVLGLGDRHVNNILIDNQTAEVIHIDFGIAFEQGKCLPTPEQVPFRLTRDVVDGMGASGIEGLFRKSCEKTMEVLRSNSQTILTILEVLLYDPLYFWTVSAAEANKRQTEDQSYKSMAEESEEENKNLSAERTLLRLQGKLQGTEQGKPTSIEQQVGNLIQQAMDPANLSRLYYGWQPYL